MPLLLTSVQASARPLLNLRWDASLLASDNPFLLPGDDRGSFAAELVARPEFEWMVSPRTRVEAAGYAGLRQYFQHYGNYLTGRARAGMHHKASDFLSASGFVGYSRELPNDALTTTVDAAVDTRDVREIVNAQTLIEWTPNSRTEVVGEVRAERTAVPESEILSTTKLYGVRLNASRRMNPLLSIGVEGEATTADVGPGDRAATQTIRFTLNRRLSSAWRADVQAGIERAQPGGLAARDDTARFNGRAQLCHEPPNTTLCVSGALRSSVSGFGVGGLQRETYFDAAYTRRISERNTIGLRAEYLRARAEPLDIRTRWTRLSATFERRLSRSAWLLSSLNYLHRKPPLGESLGGAFLQIGISLRDRP